jgi:hypothetical protein
VHTKKFEGKIPWLALVKLILIYKVRKSNLKEKVPKKKEE